MAGYGSNPTTGTQSPLPTNQIPLSSVAVPGHANGDLTALRGVNASTDSNGNEQADASIAIADGKNVAQGTTTDAAYTDGTGAASGTGMGLFKGIFVKLAAIATAIAGTLKVKGDFNEQASLTTTGTAPTNLLGSTDVSAYKWWSLHVIGIATGGTLTFKCSNDGTNFINLIAFRLDNPSSGFVSTTTSASGTIWGGPVTFRYLEVVETAWTSGNTTGVLELYTVPPAWAMTVISAIQSGTWTVQPGNTQNTTPWMVSTAGLPTGLPSYVIKEVKSVSVTAGTGLSIWTPQSGKKFRLIGWDLAPVTASSQAGIQFQDTVVYNTANEFLRVPRFLSVNWTPTPRNIGPNGYLSTAANNQLWIDVTVTTNVEGYVYGFEE